VFTRSGPFIQLLIYHSLVIMWAVRSGFCCNPLLKYHGPPSWAKKHHFAGTQTFHCSTAACLSLVFILGWRPTGEITFFCDDSDKFSVNFIRCHWKVHTKMESCSKQSHWIYSLQSDTQHRSRTNFLMSPVPLVLLKVFFSFLFFKFSLVSWGGLRPSPLGM
jgi:hypothetical protein